MQTLQAADSQILVMPPFDKEIDPRGVGYVFYTKMLKYKNNVAQIDGLTGEKDTFESLLQRCLSTAIRLKAMGVKPGDIISICTLNHINSTVPYIASQFIGATVASLEPSMSLKDTAYLLGLVKPKFIFVVQDSLKLIEQAIAQSSPQTKIILFEDSDKYPSLLNFIKDSSSLEGFKPYKTTNTLKETAVIIFSSGTTGLPKGICIHHYGYLAGIMKTLDFGFKFDIQLSFTAMFWITSITSLGISLYNGSARLFLPKFSTDTVWSAIGKYKPTYIFIAPIQLLELCKAGRPKDIDTSSVHGIMLGGAVILEKQMELFKKTFPGTICINSYGMSEIVGSTSIFKIANPEEFKLLQSKPTSCGRGVPGISYKIVDINSEKILRCNQPGELRVKTEAAFSGYYDQDSSDAWDSEGWLKTGDILYYDEEYCFYVVDRIKEVLKYSVYDVFPTVLESVLLTHPKIAKAVVVATVDEVEGDLPTGVVMLKEGAGVVSPIEIEKYVEERVPDFQRLRGGVRIVDYIPCAGSGKVKRQEVKNLVRQGLV